MGDNKRLVVIASPGAVRLRRTGGGGALRKKPKEPKPRGPIGEFSWQSRRNALYKVRTLPWTEPLGKLVMLTFTQPGRGWSQDGRVIKHQWDLFAKRCAYHYGGRWPGFWFFEFQMRGAPHFHWLAILPPEVWAEVEWDQTHDKYVHDWCREHWNAIVAPGDWTHREWGVHVSPAKYPRKNKTAGYIAGYVAKEFAKRYQKEVPEGFTSPGRFWGVTGFKPVEHELECSLLDTYYRVRRQMANHLEAATGRRPKFRGADGMWTASDDGLSLAVQALRWAESDGSLR